MLRVITRITGFLGGPWVHVSYWTGADSAAGATAANSAMGAFWNSVRSVISTAARFDTDSIVAQLDPATGTRTANYTVTSIGNPGLDAGDALPPATQALLRLRTGVFAAGREVRGRINIPGLTEPSSTNGRPTAALLTAINTPAGTLVAAAAPALAVWSRKNGIAVDVATADTWDTFAVRRSRRDPG